MRQTTRAFSFKADVQMFGYSVTDIAITAVITIVTFFAIKDSMPILLALGVFLLAIPLLGLIVQIRERTPRNHLYFLLKFFVSADHLHITNDRNPIPLVLKNIQSLLNKKSNSKPNQFKMTRTTK